MDDGALRMEPLSLKRLREESVGRGSPFTWDPGKYVKNISEYGFLSLSVSLSLGAPL
jgi:hypothetical protein